MGAPVLPCAYALDTSAQHMADVLCTIADAEDGVAATNLCEVDAEGLGVVDAIGRTRKDDADDIGIVEGHLVVGEDFAERVQLADAPSDELCGLRTEVKNDDFLHIE